MWRSQVSDLNTASIGLTFTPICGNVTSSFNSTKEVHLSLKTLVLLILPLLACDQPAPNGASSASFAQFQRAACRHEAGHALYALQFPKHLRLVSIHLSEDAGSHHGAATEFEVVGQADDFRQAVVMVGMELAGEVGEEILQGTSLNGGSSEDEAQAQRLAERLLSGSSANIPRVLAAAKSLAHDVLAPHATALRSLADELYRRKNLTVYDVRRIANGN
jgi:hypothetical protein